MPDLIFYGASDDLIEVEGVFEEEFNADHASFIVVCPDDRQARVSVAYTDNGFWFVSYGPVDEDCPAPSGRVAVDRYTARLTLDVPEKTTVHLLATQAGGST